MTITPTFIALACTGTVITLSTITAHTSDIEYGWASRTNWRISECARRWIYSNTGHCNVWYENKVFHMSTWCIPYSAAQRQRVDTTDVWNRDFWSQWHVNYNIWKVIFRLTGGTDHWWNTGHGGVNHQGSNAESGGWGSCHTVCIHLSRPTSGALSCLVGLFIHE